MQERPDLDHKKQEFRHIRKGERKKQFPLPLRVILLVTAVVLVLFSLYRLWERPPKSTQPPLPEATPVPTQIPQVAESEVPPAPEPTMTPLPEGIAPENTRQNGIYTVLLAGLDEASESTDTLLLCRLDTIAHSINCVSIPRDTLINVDWDVRRINTVYSGGKRGGGSGSENLLLQMRFLTGIDVDAYAVVSLDAFIDVIDLLGGVWFYVPIQMDYEQYYDDLFIHLEPGYQHLDGYQCMGLCRFRSDYANGDLGRIEMQHTFFKAAAEQFLTLGNLPNAAKVFSRIADGMDTNLTAANIAWFVRQAMQCSSENIHFYTMPGYGKMIQGRSYYVISPYYWLEMLNARLNPYETPLGYWNLNIVFEGENGEFTSTTEVQGPWYYDE